MSFAQYDRVMLDACYLSVKKAKHLYSALHGIQTILKRSGMDHSFTCNKHHACLYLVSVHQMAYPPIEVANI